MGDIAWWFHFQPSEIGRFRAADLWFWFGQYERQAKELGG